MRKLFFLFCFLIFDYAFSQNYRVDSLTNVLLNAKEDTLKVQLLNSLSWQFNVASKLEESKKQGKLALALAEKLNYKKGIAAAHNNMGFADERQGNYPSALKEFFASLRVNEEAGDKKAIAESHSCLAIIYNDQQDYSQLLKELSTVLQLSVETGDKPGMANTHSNIANAYISQENYAGALEEYSAALKLYEELGNRKFVAITHNNLGHVFSYQHKYSEALKEQLTALRLKEELGDKYGMAGTHNNIAINYEHQDNLVEALKEYTAAENIYAELKNKNGLANANIFIGNIKTKMENPKEGKERLLKGLALLKEIGDKEGIKSGYQGMAAADSAMGNFRGAFENHKLYVLYRDSLMGQENIKKTVRAQMEYAFNKKEAATKSEQEKKDIIQRNIRNSIVGVLAGALIFLVVVYRQRNKISKARKRSDELLLNILPSEVAEELKAKGSADAKQFDDVTVMFTDFKNFTQISEKLSPAELVAEIHTCFKAFDNIIAKHNIEKIKTIGDSYMCAGGLPIANKTNAIDVVNAAMEIQHFMNEHLQRRKIEGKEPFEIRIGVHTGPVVAGIVGVKKFAYDIWGDTVNIASRMESSGEAGKVNISGSTYQLVKEKFKCIHRGKIQAKNKGEIDMYFVDKINSGL